MTTNLTTIKNTLRTIGFGTWADGSSNEWMLFVNTDCGPTADSKSFITVRMTGETVQIMSGVPVYGFEESMSVLLADDTLTAKQNNALLDAAYMGRQENMAAYNRLVGALMTRGMTFEFKGSRVSDIKA